MNKKIGQAATELMNYSNGIIARCEVLFRLQGLGYSEQTAIFLLEILENCVDEPHPHNSMHFPARPERTGEAVTEDSMGTAMRRANRSVLTRKEDPHDL